MRTLETAANILAYLLPNGRTFGNKFQPNTKTRALLFGLAKTLLGVDNKRDEFEAEFFFDTTTKMLEEWESAFGIPNNYFKLPVSDATRKNRILVMMRANGAQTEQDFIDIAALLGITITISHTGNADPQLLPLNVPFIPAFTSNPEFVWRCTTIGQPTPFFLPRLFNSLKSVETKIVYDNT